MRAACLIKVFAPYFARQDKHGKISGDDGIATPQSILGLDYQIDLADIDSH
jgi:hypothetical protein